MYVKPREGFKVIDPSDNSTLPDEGRDVPNNTFWQRRLRDGDVISTGYHDKDVD